MTAREMQVEFERRITLMNPDFELKDKLTSDTIFSFLNAYTERFIRINYLLEDAVQDDTRALKKNSDALKGLIVRTLLNPENPDNTNSDSYTNKFKLPDEYFLYIRSNSLITSNYKQLNIDPSSPLLVTNKYVREDDIEKVMSTAYNKVILRNPYVILNAGIYDPEDTSVLLYINVLTDAYTTIKQLDLVYYRKPLKFDVLGVDNDKVLDHCELPENVHMEIVEGAVEMFITEAKYRLAGKLNNAQQQR